MMKLLLASGSPRRRELLQQMGLTFTVAPVDLDETPRPGEAPRHYVRRMALEKAQAAQARATEALVLAADTSVILEQQILGKPDNDQQAAAMLQQLSGRSHQVMTAVALAGPGGFLQDCLVVTEVQFCPLSDDQIHAYLATGEHRDKAGAYAIQGRGGIFVQHLSGSYSAVVGLPLQETAGLLAKAGQPAWQDWELTHE
ncbi:MAG: septum formation inhibitor Maf [Halomonadaceae bacterium]|nr:MAG: septum formation inhibitor Maf [Halomonadaceae bacterium]